MLVTVASNTVVSAVLKQRVNGQLAPAAFYSKLLGPAERRYSTYEKEYLVIAFGCERTRSYLEHKEFELHCDTRSVQKVSSHIYYPENRSRDLDVTWQPVRGDLTAHP